MNRFTSLPVLIHALRTKKLTLLNPNKWEDRNDAYYIQKYRELSELETVLAICFSVKEESFHNWKVFADGPGGVCIEFKKDELLKNINANPDFRHRRVKYDTVSAVESTTPALRAIPFLKRVPYKPEAEYRIVYQHKTEKKESEPLPFDLSSIKKINLSPWLHESIVPSVRDTLHSIEGCQNLIIQPSTLLENERWKNAIAKIPSLKP